MSDQALTYLIHMAKFVGQCDPFYTPPASMKAHVERLAAAVQNYETKRDEEPADGPPRGPDKPCGYTQPHDAHLWGPGTSGYPPSWYCPGSTDGASAGGKPTRDESNPQARADMDSPPAPPADTEPGDG